MSAGHHPVHTGLQSHSVGGIYPLAVVGYANGDETWFVVEHLGNGAVLGCFIGIYASTDYAEIASIASSSCEGLDKWFQGRPRFNQSGRLSM